MVHPHGSTPLKFDNKCAHGILTWVLKQKQPKGTEMRFFWLSDRYKEQEQYHKLWKRSKHNLGDYPTKHHPAKHHRTVCPLYVANVTTKFNESLATKINQFQAVCKAVQNKKSQRKWVLLNRQTKQTDKQTKNYQLLLIG